MTQTTLNSADGVSSQISKGLRTLPLSQQIYYSRATPLLIGIISLLATLIPISLTELDSFSSTAFSIIYTTYLLVLLFSALIYFIISQVLLYKSKHRFKTYKRLHTLGVILWIAGLLPLALYGMYILQS